MANDKWSGGQQSHPVSSTYAESATPVELAGDVGCKFPAPDLQVVFADTVPRMTHANGVIKYYLARIDPSITADGTANSAVSAQVIMPFDSFVAMVAFFDARLEWMIRDGSIERSVVDFYGQQNMATVDAKHPIES